MQQLYHFWDALGLPKQSEGFPGSVLVVSTRGAVGTKRTSPLEFGHALHLPEPHQNPGMAPTSVQAPGCATNLGHQGLTAVECAILFPFSVSFFFSPLISTNLSQGGMFHA